MKGVPAEFIGIDKAAALLYRPYAEFSYAQSEELILKLLTSFF